jgi:hypothetical protein
MEPPGVGSATDKKFALGTGVATKFVSGCPRGAKAKLSAGLGRASAL